MIVLSMTCLEVYLANKRKENADADSKKVVEEAQGKEIESKKDK